MISTKTLFDGTWPSYPNIKGIINLTLHDYMCRCSSCMKRKDDELMAWSKCDVPIKEITLCCGSSPCWVHDRTWNCPGCGTKQYTPAHGCMKCDWCPCKSEAYKQFACDLSSEAIADMDDTVDQWLAGGLRTKPWPPPATIRPIEYCDGCGHSKAFHKDDGCHFCRGKRGPHTRPLVQCKCVMPRIPKRESEACTICGAYHWHLQTCFWHRMANIKLLPGKIGQFRAVRAIECRTTEEMRKGQAEHKAELDVQRRALFPPKIVSDSLLGGREFADYGINPLEAKHDEVTALSQGVQCHMNQTIEDFEFKDNTEPLCTCGHAKAVHVSQGGMGWERVGACYADVDGADYYTKCSCTNYRQSKPCPDCGLYKPPEGVEPWGPNECKCDPEIEVDPPLCSCGHTEDIHVSTGRCMRSKWTPTNGGRNYKRISTCLCTQYCPEALDSRHDTHYDIPLEPNIDPPCSCGHDKAKHDANSRCVIWLTLNEEPGHQTCPCTQYWPGVKNDPITHRHPCAGTNDCEICVAIRDILSYLDTSPEERSRAPEASTGPASRFIGCTGEPNCPVCDPYEEIMSPRGEDDPPIQNWTPTPKMTPLDFLRSVWQSIHWLYLAVPTSFSIWAKSLYGAMRRFLTRGAGWSTVTTTRTSLDVYGCRYKPLLDHMRSLDPRDWIIY